MLKFIPLLAIPLVLLFVGRGDYEDELQAEAFYSEMVCSKLWPDYKQLNPTCESES